MSKNKVYQNYHKHTSFTNPLVPDSCALLKDYAERAKDLEHGIISTCEHGWQGRYIEGYELAKEYNLKFVFGSEAYWVKDRKEKDGSNCHIYIGAKNENGRQCINDILSEANITGYYKRPRIDLELLFSLPENDVIITTACIAFWKYENIDNIVYDLKKHFRNNFFLEVQNHNTDKQKELNRHIIDLSNQLSIPIIMGIDSHYIYPDQSDEREFFLESKEIRYQDEAGWYLDYPDDEIAYNRFIEQGVLTEAQINEAFDNTNIFLDVEEYDSNCFNDELKMPDIYPKLSRNEKVDLLKNIIYVNWEKVKKEEPYLDFNKYEQEIEKEIDTIISTNFENYFILGNKMVELGKKKGGYLSETGRGSCVSNYTNKLLGFTNIDRISAEVDMFPERFMSKSRMLEARKMPDIDFNVSNREVFVEALDEVLGEGHCKPMIAFGYYKTRSAWQLFAKFKKIDKSIANEISKQIGKYEKELNSLDDEEDRKSINVLDYIDEQYKDIFIESNKYKGIINNFSQHASAYLVYQGDIRREIGLIRTRSGMICTVMDGDWADKYKFLKEDLLIVDVVYLINKVFERIGLSIPDAKKLINIISPDDDVWNIYKNGLTIGVNQVQSPGTTARIMKYNPTNIAELCAFIAAIRPGFKSMYNKFENREEFNFGVKTLDDVIQTTQFKQSYILYQETQMKVLNYSGISMSETYEVINYIKKKKSDKIKEYQPKFLSGFSEKLIENENIEKKHAQSLAQEVWQVIEDSSKYAFNASHSYCVAVDSLYCAYLKQYYPLQYYTVLLNIFEEKGKKDNILKAKKEAETGFNIRFPAMRFRQDNRKITEDIESNSIHMSLVSIKSFSLDLAQKLYECKDFEGNSFVNLLIYIEEKVGVSKKIRELIILQYFIEFGNNKKLCKIFDEFFSGKNKYKKSYIEKTKIKRKEYLLQLESNLPDEKLPLKEQIDYEYSILGYLQCRYDVAQRYGYVIDINKKYSPRLDIYFLHSGKTQSLKFYNKTFSYGKRRIKGFEKYPIKLGDIIYCNQFLEKNGVVSDGNGGFIETPDKKVLWVTDYEICNDLIL